MMLMGSVDVATKTGQLRLARLTGFGDYPIFLDDTRPIHTPLG